MRIPKNSVLQPIAVLLALLAIFLAGYLVLFDHESHYALVDDAVIAAPRNLPPFQNDATIWLKDVDGQPIERIVLGFFDRAPEAKVDPGEHLFHVEVLPSWKRPNDLPREVTFAAFVEGGKTYFIVSKGELIFLVEARNRDQPNRRALAFRKNPSKYARVEDRFPCSLIKIDDDAIDRVPVHFWEDPRTPAIVDIGVHRFQVKVALSRGDPYNIPRSVAFTAAVEAGRKYILVSKEGLVGLEEAR
jgi:hypothetical protein